MARIFIGLILVLAPHMVSSAGTYGSASSPQLESSSTAQEVSAKGYIAKDYYVRVQDGNYLVNLVACTNPLINNGKSGLPNKEVVLFVHGALSNGNIFIINSEGASPKDYSYINASFMGENDVGAMLEDSPAANSLVYLLLDFGHEVWIMNRRPTVQARSRCNRNSDEDGHKHQPVCGDQCDFVQDIEQVKLNHPMDSRYWNFSLEEQAAYDIPQSIEFILEKSGRKRLSIVSHSAGGALVLMSLILKPDLSDKISKNILWAPAMYLGRGPISAQDSTNTILGALYTKFSEAEPDTFQAQQQQLTNKVICKQTLKRLTTCNTFLGYMGKAEDQEAYETAFDTPDYMESSSTHELAHLFQAAYFKKMHSYVASMSPNLKQMHQRNGQAPRIYDVTKIRGPAIQLWIARDDAVVSPADLDALALDLNGTIPVKQRMFGGDGITFQHSSFFTHRKAGKIALIPALVQLQS